MKTLPRAIPAVRRAVPAVLLALAAGALVVARAASGPDPAGSVSFLAGEASRKADGKDEKLALGSLVYQGDLIETGARTRLEIKLADQSALRVGPLSKLHLVTAMFGKTVDERQVNAKLVVGNVWAQVVHALAGKGKFEVQTENAVAGVRGTTFRVDAKQDRSCVVKVYAGTVAVAGNSLPRPAHDGADGGASTPPKPGQRVQVAGPKQVSREQWERLVGAMMQVRISADGKPGEPEAFAVAATGEDEWEEWNRTRDNP